MTSQRNDGTMGGMSMFELIEEHGVEKALEIWREEHAKWVAENPPPTPERIREIAAEGRRREVVKRGTIRV